MTDTRPGLKPRQLLARLRDIMATHELAQVRLDRIVRLIAEDLAAEVCSFYVRRAGDLLELFANVGFKEQAVHFTRLRVGEGVVGDIAAHARPLALSDAQSHPKFVFRPETGEELYHSLMGVPILRGGRVIGVLVVQNKTFRRYLDEDVETLQTVAMVLAEMVAGGELIGKAELLPADGNALLPLRLEGVRFNGGIAIGTAVLHEPQVAVDRMVATDIGHEHARLHQAVADMHGALDALFRKGDLQGAGEHREVIETYRMIAEDAGWLSRIDEAINGGLTAEAAVQKVQSDIRARMSQVQDAYLKERIHDFEDLAHRLLRHLLGEDGKAAQGELPTDAVIVARNMGPAQLLDYDRAKVRGLVLEEGTATSHVAIIARALDIPVIGHVRDVLGRIENGDPVIVDGDRGQVFIRPGEDIQLAFAENLKAIARQRDAYADLKDLPAVTLDGQRIDLLVNVGLLAELEHVERFGADGVGLYRTEVPFMVRSDFPTVPEQAQFYGRVLDQAHGRPVVFRTLDVGGDKVLPYWQTADEENPAMGWRAIRISLDRPAMLRQQLRALLRAGAGRDLYVMFPMIADVAEFSAARDLLDMELDRERRLGATLPAAVQVGAMLEVPSLAFQLPALLKQVDFLSIGSNDLMQFLFACDRGNPRLSERYDMLSPPVLNFLGSVAEQCAAVGKPFSLCGEMASRPLEAMTLIGLGFRRLSVVPATVWPVKAMIRSLRAAPLADYLADLRQSTQRSLRERLKAFARDHGVVLPP
ncbi:MAG: phosphoenolpyruvate--protein phosphotransferase [Magnetospirillum sp. WYHS-4]